MPKITLSTPLGALSVITHMGMLVYCNWVSPDCIKKEEKFRELDSAPIRPRIIEVLTEQLAQYFHGERKGFDIPYRLYGTDFQKRVWENLRKIPYGQTVTYSQLARMIGNPLAYRAVARACGANPLALILPCHRVVASSGKLGGYTGGIDKKESLLCLESYYCPLISP